MIEIDLLPAGEGAPGDTELDVGRERRVAALARLEPRPLRRRDHLAGWTLISPKVSRSSARSAERAPNRGQSGDSSTRKPSTASRPLVVPDSARIASRRRRPGAGSVTPRQRRRCAAPLRRARPATSDGLPGHALGTDADSLDQRAERRHLLGDGRIVALDRDQLRHRLARDRLAPPAFQSRTRPSGWASLRACRAGVARPPGRCGCRGASPRACRTRSRSD